MFLKLVSPIGGINSPKAWNLPCWRVPYLRIGP